MTGFSLEAFGQARLYTELFAKIMPEF